MKTSAVVKDEKGHKKTLSKLVALLGALVAGNLDALFLLPFELATAFDYLMVVVSVPLFALSAVVCAALGPLLVTCFALGMFRVEGGTAIAIISPIALTGEFAAVAVSQTIGIFEHLTV